MRRLTNRCWAESRRRRRVGRSTWFNPLKTLREAVVRARPPVWTNQAQTFNTLNTLDPAWTRAARLGWRKLDRLSTDIQRSLATPYSPRLGSTPRSVT